MHPTRPGTFESLLARPTQIRNRIGRQADRHVPSTFHRFGCGAALLAMTADVNRYRIPFFRFAREPRSADLL